MNYFHRKRKLGAKLTIALLYCQTNAPFRLVKFGRCVFKWWQRLLNWRISKFYCEGLNTTHLCQSERLYCYQRPWSTSLFNFSTGTFKSLATVTCYTLLSKDFFLYFEWQHVFSVLSHQSIVCFSQFFNLVSTLRTHRLSWILF